MHSNFKSRPSEFHRYRIGVIESWPESAWKQSALESARSAFERERYYERAFAVLERQRSTRAAW